MSCPYAKQCGFCRINESYEDECSQKLARVRELLKPYTELNDFVAAKTPARYRSKVTASFAMGKDRKLSLGHYEEGSRSVVSAEDCLLENEKAAAILKDTLALCRSFHFQPYDTKSNAGLLRHVQLRFSESTGQIMMILVTGTPVFPSRNNFAKELRKKHPEITTLIQSVNSRPGSMVLGDRFQTLYGPGYIEDKLLGLNFRLSPGAFYQINSEMTPILYQSALDFANLNGNEHVVDAYCGTGTIGLTAAAHAAQVIGFELNPDAVRDAITNARRNKIENARFICADAGDALQNLALSSEKIDCILMDPPRSGSSESFLAACLRLSPTRIVYVSCGPESLARDIEILTRGGYRVTRARCVDMFPRTEHVETVVLLSRITPDTYITVELDMSELDLTSAEAKATYNKIRDFVKNKYGFHVTNLNIAQVKQKYGIIERVNYNVSEGKSRVPNAPQEKFEAIEDALRFYKMI